MRPGSAIAASASRLRVFSLRELVVHRRRTTASFAVMAVSAMYLVAIIGIFGSITGSVNRLADGIAGVAALEVSGITDAGFPDTITADVGAVPVGGAVRIVRPNILGALGEDYVDLPVFLQALEGFFDLRPLQEPLERVPARVVPRTVEDLHARRAIEHKDQPAGGDDLFLAGQGGSQNQEGSESQGPQTQTEDEKQPAPANPGLAEIGPEREQNEDGANEDQAAPTEEVAIAPGPFAVGGQKAHGSTPNRLHPRGRRGLSPPSATTKDPLVHQRAAGFIPAVRYD